MRRRGFLAAIGLAPLAALLARKAAAEPVTVTKRPLADGLDAIEYDPKQLTPAEVEAAVWAPGQWDSLGERCRYGGPHPRDADGDCILCDYRPADAPSDDVPNVPGMPGYAWRETEHCGHPAYERRHDGLLVFTLNGRDWLVERTPGSRANGVEFPSALAACQAADMWVLSRSIADAHPGEGDGAFVAMLPLVPPGWNLEMTAYRREYWLDDGRGLGIRLGYDDAVRDPQRVMEHAIAVLRGPDYTAARPFTLSARKDKA